MSEASTAGEKNNNNLPKEEKTSKKATEVSKKPTVSEKDPEKGRQTAKEDDEDHQQWGNQAQFILTAIGLAVGLGNIWKFPYVAYDNGGSAFLIPYIFFGITFGIPVIYLEFLIGQYSRVTPTLSFYRLAPAFGGLGYFMAIVCLVVGAFYSVVISWAELYLGYTIIGWSQYLPLCNNDWNTPNCIATASHLACRKRSLELNTSLAYALDNKGNCTDLAGAHAMNGSMSGMAEFFTRVVVKHSSGFEDFAGEYNWPVALCVLFFYVLCALTLWKGIKILEKTAYVTVPLPYIVVAIFFVRAILLDGSYDGIRRYLFAPDMGKLLKWETWRNALTQLCFSLTLGFGALPSLASHSKKTNNCFRDAFLVVGFDTLMSVVGGVAVFGTLGFLAKQSGKEFEQVVAKGPGLAFIAYPEAISMMPVEWLWNLLFFIMLFLLGFSSLVGIIDTVSTCLLQASPKLGKSKKWKVLVPCLICILLATVGLFFCSSGGYWWFELLTNFTGETTPSFGVALELVVIAYCYRFVNVQMDMEEMWGPRPERKIKRVFSRFSPYFKWNWLLVSPVFAIVVAGITLNRKVPFQEVGSSYVYPIWVEVCGWFINLGPALVIIIMFIVNWMAYRKKNIAFKYLFMPTKDYPSHDRYYRLKGIPPPDGWNKELGEMKVTETPTTTTTASTKV